MVMEMVVLGGAAGTGAGAADAAGLGESRMRTPFTGSAIKLKARMRSARDSTNSRPVVNPQARTPRYTTAGSAAGSGMMA